MYKRPRFDGRRADRGWLAVFLSIITIAGCGLASSPHWTAVRAIQQAGGSVQYLDDARFSVNLNDSSVTDADLSCLSQLSDPGSMQWLTLSRTGVSDAGLKHFSPLIGLEYLYLDDTSITGSGLADISGLLNLKYLALTNTGVKDENLQHLEGMTDLVHLYLNGTNVTVDGVQPLAQALPGCRIEVDAVRMARGPALRKSKAQATVNDRFEIDTLSLRGCEVTDSLSSEFDTLTDLTTLDLTGCQVPGQALRHVAALPRLKRLYLRDAIIADDDLQYLKGAASLEHLNLNGTGITDAGVKHLTELPALLTLELQKTKMTDEALEAMLECPSLTQVWVHKTDVTAAGVARFREERPNIYISHGP